jgi:hypothetical protein
LSRCWRTARLGIDESRNAVVGILAGTNPAKSAEKLPARATGAIMEDRIGVDETLRGPADRSIRVLRASCATER